MKMDYSFASDSEPTEAQLKELMHEVALKAKEKAEAADLKLRETIRQATLAALQVKQGENKP
jgi:hypothetical protein